MPSRAWQWPWPRARAQRRRAECGTVAASYGVLYGAKRGRRGRGSPSRHPRRPGERLVAAGQRRGRRGSRRPEEEDDVEELGAALLGLDSSSRSKGTSSAVLLDSAVRPEVHGGRG